MSAESIKLGQAFVEFSVITKNFEKDINSIVKKVDDVGNKITGIAKNATMFFAAKMGVVIGLTQHFASVGDQLDKMSIRTNMSVKSLSEMKFALTQCGSNLETFEMALNKVSENLTKAPDKFRALGLSVSQMKNLDAENRFFRIADALRGIESPAKQTAAVIDLFGDSGTKLLPLINAGVQGADQLRLMANQLNITMTKEDTDKAAALSDAYDRFSRSIQSVSLALGAVFAPVMTEMANRWAVNLNWVKDAIKNHQYAITIFSGVVSIVGYCTVAVYGLGLAVKGLSLFISYVSSVFHALGGTFNALGKTVNWVSSSVGFYTKAFSDAANITKLSYLDCIAWAEKRGISIKQEETLTFASIKATKQAVAAEQLLLNLGIQRQGALIKTCAGTLMLSRSELSAAIHKKMHAAANFFLCGSEVELFKAKTVTAVATKNMTLWEITCYTAKKTAATFNWMLAASQKVLNFFMENSIADITIMTGSFIARNVAMAISNTLTFVAVAATQGFCAAVLGLNMALAACPITGIAGGFILLGAALALAIGYFYSGESAATKYAQSMEKLKEKNDRVRQTHQHTLEKLEKLSAKEALSVKEQEDVKKSVAQLNSSYSGLNLTIDESTGNLKDADKAVKAIKESMNSAAQNDLAKTIRAINAETQELKGKLNNRGETGYWRGVGTYFTFGYVDNADEIKSKIEENKKKVQELTTEKIKIEIEAVVEFSDNFEQAEKKIAEFAEKDRREGLSETDKKADDLKKEFEERKKALELTVREAEEYEKTGKLSKQQLELLAKRRALLNSLTAMETERKNQIYKADQTDAENKLQDMDDKLKEENSSEQEKKIAAIQKEFAERKKLLGIIIESLNAQTNLTKEQTDYRDKLQEKLKNMAHPTSWYIDLCIASIFSLNISMFLYP